MVAYSDYSKYVPSELFAGAARAMLRDLTTLRTGKDISDLVGSRKIDEYFIPFITLAPFLKDSSFREEREYRLVVTCIRPSVELNSELLEKLKAIDAKPIKLKARGDGSLVPYIELFKDLKATLPIRSVIVGPHKNQLGQKAALEFLLEQHNLNIEVRLSSIPYRE